MSWAGFVKLRGKPKGRPRVTKNGTFMPPDYQAWREEFGWLLKAARGAEPRMVGNVELHLGFHTDGVQIVLVDKADVMRGKHVQADIDNLICGVMEVLEDVGVVANDKQVVKVIATVYEGKESKREKAKDD